MMCQLLITISGICEFELSRACTWSQIYEDAEKPVAEEAVIHKIRITLTSRNVGSCENAHQDSANHHSRDSLWVRFQVF